MQVKLRPTCQADHRKAVYGLTVPQDIAIFFKECLFTVTKSGTSIIFTSGCSVQPTKEQVKNFKFETQISGPMGL